MPTKIDHVQDGDFLIVTITGPANLPCLEQALTTVVSSEHWPPTIPTIWDGRRADISAFDHRAMASLAKTRISMDSVRGPTRSALVVRSDMEALALKVFTTLARNLSAKVAVFRDFDAALAWIRQPQPDLDILSPPAPPPAPPPDKATPSLQRQS